MANIDVNFYDYNGSIWAFGIINGYSTVKSVRMYVSNGSGTTYQYCSSQVYDKNVARINTSVYGSSSFMFNIRTDRDADPGYPAQLNYNVVDPEDSSGRGRYKISFHFYSSSDGSGNPLNSSVLTPSANGQSDVWFQMHHSLSTPSASFNSNNNILTVTGAGSHRCNLRIVKKNRVNNPNFPPEVRDYAYKVNMQSLEGTMGGKYTENYPNWIQDYNSDDDIECKYQRGGIDYSSYNSTKVRVLFDSGANYTQTNINNYMSIIQDAFDEIAEYTGMSFDISSEVWSAYQDKTNEQVDDYIANSYNSNGTRYLMYVRVGNDSTMGLTAGYSGYWSFYTWSKWREDGILYDSNHSTSIAHINTDQSQANESINHVFHEEIYQSLNIGTDNFDYPLSIHYDPHHPNPDSYNIPDTYNGNIAWDKELLRFFYTYNLAGKTPIELINEYDTPCCLVNNDSSSTRTFDLSALNAGTYVVDVWVCAQGTSNPGGGTWSSENVTMDGSIGTSHYNWDGGWDDAPYSLHYQLEITIQSVKPDKWVWSSNITSGNLLTVNSYGIHPVSATEWNNFTARINEFREYAGKAAYGDFTPVSRGSDFKTAYNHAVKAIKMDDLQGESGNYGNFVNYITNSTTAISNSHFQLSLLTSIASEANAIAGYT